MCFVGTDINECVSPVLNECGATSGCVNTPGSYRCTCYDGAVLENDGHTCSGTHDIKIRFNKKGLILYSPLIVHYFSL